LAQQFIMSDDNQKNLFPLYNIASHQRLLGFYTHGSRRFPLFYCFCEIISTTPQKDQLAKEVE